MSNDQSGVRHLRVSEEALLYIYWNVSAAITAKPNLLNAFTLHQAAVLHAEEAKQRDLPPPQPPCLPSGVIALSSGTQAGWSRGEIKRRNNL